MHKSWTLKQRSIGIIAVVSLLVVTTGLLLYARMNVMSTEQAGGLERVVQESEVARLVAKGVHDTTKMASSFKNVMLRGASEKHRDKYSREFEEFIDGYVKDSDRLKNIPVIASNPVRLKAVADWRDQFDAVSQKYRAQLKLYVPGDDLQYMRLDAAVNGIDRAVVASGNALLKDSEAAQQAATAQLKAIIDHSITNLSLWLNGALGMTLLALCACLYGFTRSIIGQLGMEPSDLSQMSQRIAQGDLTVHQQQTAHNAPVGSVAHAFESMRDSLALLVSGLRQRAQHLDESLQDIRAQLSTVDESAQEQANTSSAMAAGVEELSVSVQQLGSVADQTARASQVSCQVSVEGKGLIDQSAQDVQETAQGAERLSTTVQSLGRQSESITQIIATIESIAEQTNLLALNAAIEAARAGESGRGFAVVADEVRRLAERTTESTSEIEQMVSAIQRGTQSAVDEMVVWADSVNANLSRMQQARTVLNQLGHAASEVSGLVVEVNASLAEQQKATHQMSSDIEKLAARSEENASCVIGIRRTLDELAALSSQLSEDSARFRV
ncbi:methyl-accepting chemotaxis protein [Limnobacter humi]|uniref:Methyl-accepting chemotaxis protein n=1 Tax=Limnobacter humi TaxID=1778671 RepID=A0ABT1WIM2_9BURK|nr:methyl-accepting chemotaxis protein [Limnobacter humi]MCQ8896886.1 methyl-accepting chemotaxis protein [Limnobacter humi]